MKLLTDTKFKSKKTGNVLSVLTDSGSRLIVESSEGSESTHKKTAFLKAISDGEYIEINKKPSFTLPNGEIKKYTGSREVKSFWFFKHEGKSSDNKDMYTGGFSINEKSASSTAKSNFSLYRDGGHDLVLGSIVVSKL